MILKKLLNVVKMRYLRLETVVQELVWTQRAETSAEIQLLKRAVSAEMDLFVTRPVDVWDLTNAVVLNQMEVVFWALDKRLFQRIVQRVLDVQLHNRTRSLHSWNLAHQMVNAEEMKMVNQSAFASQDLRVTVLTAERVKKNFFFRSRKYCKFVYFSSFDI